LENKVAALLLHSTGTIPNLQLPHFLQCFHSNLWN